MTKAKVKAITISDRIYIKKQDIENYELLTSLFTYFNGEEHLSTVVEYDNYVTIPSNGYNKLEWENIEDLRNFEQLDYCLEFSGTLRPEQQDIVNSFTKRGRARSGVIKAPCGFGKCKPYFSKILTSKGLLSLKELKGNTSNTEIINHTGSYPIHKHFDNGVEECFAIHTDRGTIVRGTAKHPLLTWNTEKLVIEYKKIAEIVKGDYIIGKLNTNMFGNIEEPNAYMLGLLVGDGSLTLKGRIGFSSGDIETQQYYENFFHKNNIRIYPKENHIEYYTIDYNWYETYITSNGLDCKSIEKPVSAYIRSFNKESTISFLSGLFDTDGCANLNGTIEFCSSSEEIAEYVHIQLLNLGIINTLKKKKTTHSDIFTITITSKYFCLKFFDIIGFRIKRKQNIKEYLLRTKNGSINVGKFVNLNKVIYKEYSTYLANKNKGYSKTFCNYKTNNISITKLNEVIDIFEKEKVSINPIISQLKDCYALKVVDKISIGELQTYDIEVQHESHSYVSEGVVNHNTFTSCALIAENNSKTLILVHTKLLYKQWIEELEKLLPKEKIGRVGAGEFDLQNITVAIYKTVHNNLDKICDHASLVIVDEAHMAPADMFSTTLNNLNAKIKIGVTATPRRKDGKHVFFADYFTDFLIEAQDTRKLAVPNVKIMKTDVKFNVIDPKRDWVKQISKLAENENYLDFIATLAIKHIARGRCPLILSERVGMLESLQKKIPNSICLLGKTSEDARKDALANAGTKYKALLSTKLFDEGISCHRADTLILTCPSSNTIKLEQRIGRIEREHPDKQHPLILDIWLSGTMVSRQQNNRLQWYKSRGYNIL